MEQTITKEELKTMLESNNVISMSDNDFSLLFRAIDSDQNGTINFAEFSSFLSSLPPPEEESSDAWYLIYKFVQKGYQYWFMISSRSDLPRF